MRWQQWLSIVPMLAGTFATALMFGGRDAPSPSTYVVGAVFGLSTLGMLVLNVGGAGPRKAELMRARRDYVRYLGGIRRRVRGVIAEQRAALGYRHPPPASLWAEAIGARVWERRPGDADFAVVRVGVGPQSLATPLVAPILDPSADLEPVTAGALRRFLNAYSIVPDLPVAVALASFRRIAVDDDGDGDRARGLVRAMLGQLATFHAPDHLLIGVCAPAARRREWEWLKWLGHAQHPVRSDAVGRVRLVGSSLTEMDQLLDDVLATRGRLAHQPPRRPGESPAREVAAVQVVVVVDGESVDGTHRVLDGLAGVTVVEVNGASGPAEPAGLTLTIHPDGTLSSSTVDGDRTVGRADQLAPAAAEGLARRLARLRPPSMGADQPTPHERGLAELLGLGDLRYPPAVGWLARPARDVLRVPIGTDADGAPLELDLKEAAQGGMGPHGLVIGATGSGKSELLRTLVLGLAATHSSEALNVVLVDFKGGATFASLDRLPHTSAVITNLAAELPLVDRMNDALSGELTRRQELLRRAGNLASLRDYDNARVAGAPLAPIPALVLVCDEFTELLTAKPDFIDLFLQIGRVGRSLGIHLLLATQRLEEGRLRGLEANLSYRIALRTFTPGESRAVLGVGDAADLPAAPGHGYLRVGTGAPQRFRSAYVSGPYRRPAPGRGAEAPRVQWYSSEPAPVTAPPSTSESIGGAAGSLAEAIIDRLAGLGPPAHRVWLAPLAESVAVEELLGGLVLDPDRGVTAADPGLRGPLRVPVAVVDRPFDQRRDVGWLDLAGSAGHVVVVGGPQCGKSTAICTLVTALALTHTPDEVHVYGLDFGGGSLAGLQILPHVGGVASRLEPAVVRRTVGEIASLLADRERRFAGQSMATLRQHRGDPDPTGGVADIFLVVDGWATLRHEYEELETEIVDIATRGLSYGIHLVAATGRWADLRPAIKDLFGSVLELRLGDPGDSAVSRRSAANVPAGSPGRGLWSDGLHILTARPQAAGHSTGELCAGIAAAWTGARAPAVRMLPALLPYQSLLEARDGRAGEEVPVGTGWALPIGIAEGDLRPVLLDFAQEPHLVAFGDSGCGKSTLLRVLAESIVRRYTPEQARLVLIDYRRSLLGAVATEHLIGYGTGADSAGSLLESVAAHLERRRPDPDVTAQQLRDRSWWSGPECFVLVDDYDLVTAAVANPLLPLVEYLAQARDVGLHLVVVRRAGGAGRAMFEPVLQRLRELGSPGLVLAGDRDEGPLVGSVRPGPQPPGRGWLVSRRDGTRLVQLAHLAG